MTDDLISRAEAIEAFDGTNFDDVDTSDISPDDLPF